MWVFIVIAIIGFIGGLISFILGEAGGAAGDFAHDLVIDHEVSLDHPDSGGPGVFSPRVIFAFLTEFGAAGSIAMYYHLNWMACSVIGLCFGLVMAAFVFGIVSLIYKQQAGSGTTMAELVGMAGTVSVTIGAKSTGQVQLISRGAQVQHFARAVDGQEICYGTQVKVEKVVGDHLIVSVLK